ncbi:MAG: heparin lyase I family protein, partial [Tunicatimonas sp.]
MKSQSYLPTLIDQLFRSALLGLLAIGWLSASTYAQSLYLDFEPPDADVRADNSTPYQYYEGGAKFKRESANSWGSGQLISEGRHPGSPNSLQVVWPADGRQGATNRMEWKFWRWQPNQAYWTGFSIKFDENYPTPLMGQQGTMFSQMKNSGSGAQLKYYIRNKTSINDPLEFWMQILYGQSSSNRQILNINPGTILLKGEWIDVVSQYKINPNQSDSFIKVWINGTQVVDYDGPIGFTADTGSGDHKIGLYGGSQNAERLMLIDEVRYGNSYAAVDPAQGGTPPPPPTAPTQVEAETASNQAGFSPFETGNDSNASGGQFIHAPGRNSKSSVPSSGRANYSFNLAASGDATLTARVLASSTSSNSFWYQIDGGTWQPWYINNTSNSWQEVTQTISSLSAGSHTLNVTYREGGTKLDWFSLESNQLAGGELEAESASLQSGFSPLETGNDNNASG